MFGHFRSISAFIASAQDPTQQGLKRPNCQNPRLQVSTASAQDPTQQGLKHRTDDEPSDFAGASAQDPTQQGLKLSQSGGKVVLELRFSARSNTTRIETMIFDCAHSPISGCFSARSNTTRIETLTPSLACRTKSRASAQDPTQQGLKQFWGRLIQHHPNASAQDPTQQGLKRSHYNSMWEYQNELQRKIQHNKD